MIFPTAISVGNAQEAQLAARELIWSDEFEGTALDTTKWLLETGAHGWGNKEWQNYTADGNVEVKDGILKIWAKKEGTGQHPGDYTSARLNSKESFTYGQIEIRAKMPDHKGNGLWPALWMLGTNIGEVGWPDCGEIDIMEYVSFDPNHVHATIHSRANNHRDGTQVTSGPVALRSMEEEFHTYGLIWTEDSLRFYLDRPENTTLEFKRPQPHNAANWPFAQPFYFLMNVAVGGEWGGQKGVDDTIFPAALEVDFVRVYRLQP